MEQLPLFGAGPRLTRRVVIPPLSKSRFGAGLQCHKRLYFDCYHRELADPPDPTTLALFEVGRKVGIVAQGRYPGGVSVADTPWRHEEAANATRAALGDPDTRAVFEAAFTYQDFRVRVDVLAAAGDGAWDLIEVKASSGFKEEYVTDIAAQLYAVEGFGLPVRRAFLLHVNSQYLYEGGSYDVQQLFTERDVTEAARDATPHVLRAINAMRVPLWELRPPEIAVGAQCKKPYPCPYYKHCHADGPEHPLHQLPRVGPKLFRALRDAAIDDIRHIPEDFDGLTDLHRRIRASVITGRVHADPALKRALDALAPPVHFLDFETCNPALPIYAGTRPFQQIPFQWSLHTLDRDGVLTHREYLHTDRSDPRRSVARSLLEALGDEGPIVVYSGFEERIIRCLAEDLDDRCEDLLALAETRIVDLLELIREHYYHPNFKGSFSIKGVLPALIADLDYDDLEIREGGQAANAYVRMIEPAATDADQEDLAAALRAYCRRDTEAMVRLFQKLKEDG